MPRPPAQTRLAIRLRSLCFLLALGFLIGQCTWLAGSGSAQDAIDIDGLVAPAVLDEDLSEVESALPDGLPVYSIEVTFDTSDPEAPRYGGEMSLSYTNTTGRELDELPLRLYANGPADGNAAITVEDLTVDGEAADVELSVENSVAAVPFPQPLGDSESAAIELTFDAELPLDSRDHYGIFGANGGTGTWALAHWYPVVAGFDPDRGFVLDPPSSNGDPIFSDTALYEVSITADATWALVTTGTEVEAFAPDGGQSTRRFVSGPVRDFTIVADDDARSVTRDLDGVTVRSWFNPGDEETGEAVADYAVASLEVFEPLLGPYPYREIDLVAVDLAGAAGVEFPQLIYIGGSYYGQELDETPNSLEFTVVHEMIHQWFYALVGNNQYDHAFIDEGLTNFLTARVFYERAYDVETAAQVSAQYLTAPFVRLVENGDDMIVDTPTDDFESGNQYVAAAYVKAPLGFAAVYDQVGDDAFIAALDAYIEEFQFRVAGPDDLLAAFEEASGDDLGELWRHWFEAAEGREDIQR